MPTAFAPRFIELLPAQTYKVRGNLDYKAKEYQMAIENYGCSIQACTEEEQDMNADLHRNRAQANLLLGRSEYALQDANRSVELLGSSAKTNSLNRKVLYRAGRALYALRRFIEAQAMYEQALDYSPADGDSLKALGEVKRRIIEATTGAYDMDSIIALNRTQPRRLNVASWNRFRCLVPDTTLYNVK